MTRRAAREPFGPQWLAARLAQILPGYPAVSLCVALSGGLDSTALLAALALAARAARRSRPQVRAVHVDHGLQPDSPLWSAHCRGLAASLGIGIEILAARIDRKRGDSLEAVARAARYALLAANLAPGEFLLTAHHEDDQLETVLLQLFRGSGLAGLAAMPELTRFASGWLARPLLTCTREKLAAWTTANAAAWTGPRASHPRTGSGVGSGAVAVGWIEDDMNADERLDRNYLRRRVLPLIRERWSGVGPSVSRSARHAAEAQALLDALGRRDAERAADGDSLAAGGLRALPPDRRRNALRFWIARSGHAVPDTRRLDEMCGPMLDARDDANPRVEWAGVCVQREGGRVSIRSPVADSSTGEITWRWSSDRSSTLPDGLGKLELRKDPRGPLDLDALPETATVRFREGGERLRPKRGGPSRALKNLLQEAHVPVIERRRLPLICSGERVLAAADLWCDESVQAGPGTHRRGRIRWVR